LIFYLGTHEISWLGRTAFPLFVSRRRLARRKSLPVAACPYAIDSGGFTELNLFGAWQTSPRRYADECRRYRDEIGPFDFAAIQDWMCEPPVRAKTGKTVREHQRLTIESYQGLMTLAPEIPWAPVLQGWEIEDYLSHADQWVRAGVCLASAPRVGVGSVCRRQGTRFAVELFDALKATGAKLHGFGLKVGAVRAGVGRIASSDSLAWSYHARRRPALAGHGHKSCTNCLSYATLWREELIGLLRRPQQDRLVFGDDRPDWGQGILRRSRHVPHPPDAARSAVAPEIDGSLVLRLGRGSRGPAPPVTGQPADVGTLQAPVEETT
jgi:hypothetical protein